MGESNRKQVWVIGHKNPDTDAICAAITYANFKNHVDDRTFIPKRCGNVNSETAYVLERFVYGVLARESSLLSITSI